MRLTTILFCLPLWGQVRILATPEPMTVLNSLGLRALGLWSISVCNETAAAVNLPRERLVLALPTVRIVSNERARAVLAHAQGRTPAARAAGAIRYILLGSTAGSALLAVRQNAAGRPACRYCAEATAGLAVGGILADQVARRLESEVPSLAPWLAGLDDAPMTLAVGACGSRTVFAALVQGAKPVEAKIPASEKEQ